MQIEDGIFALIGHTPVVRLRRLFADAPFEVYAKLEGFNPGGSIKDRPAHRIIREAIRTGELRPDSVVIESSSGNMGISLAQLCCYLGLRFICVVDPRTTSQHRQLIKRYGGELSEVLEPDAATGEFLPARLERVRQLLAATPNSFWPNQYGNKWNRLAHAESTMPELIASLGVPDLLFVGVSSCGTISGCADYVRMHGLKTKIVAVDTEGSLLFGGTSGPRRFPGLGAGLLPGLHRPEDADLIVRIDDRACVENCLALLKQEAILAGASSGCIIAAIQHSRASIAEGAVCAALLPDRGERYLDTVYNDAWVREHLPPYVPPNVQAEQGGEAPCSI